jgi:hypothetical protein
MPVHGRPCAPLKRKFLQATTFPRTLSSAFGKNLSLFFVIRAHGITPFAALLSLMPFRRAPFQRLFSEEFLPVNPVVRYPVFYFNLFQTFCQAKKEKN